MWGFWRRRELEDAICEALAQGELAGLGIQQRVMANTGKRLLFGRVYPVLYRLEDRGVIVGRWGDATAERGGYRRRYYRLAHDLS